MTFEAGTKLDLAETCDKVLEYLYFRKSQTIDADQAQIELPFGFERFELGAKRLEDEGLVKITHTKGNWYLNITEKGEIFYRTTSFKEKSKEERSKKWFEKFSTWKGVIELVIALVTIGLTIYSMMLDNRIKQLESELRDLKKRVNIENTEK